MTGTLIRRLYRHRWTRLSPELHRGFLWWYSAIGNIEPRTEPPKQQTPVAAHTDAQGHGRIAAAHFGSSREFIRLHLPQWFCAMAESAEGESPIFLYEMRAAILTVYVANDWNDTTPMTCVVRGQPSRGSRPCQGKFTILHGRCVSEPVLECRGARQRPMLGRVRRH